MQRWATKVTQTQSLYSMSSSVMSSLKFIDVGTHDSAWSFNRMILKSTVLQRDASNVIGRTFIMQQDNGPKHSANTIAEIQILSQTKNIFGIEEIWLCCSSTFRKDKYLA